MRQPEDAPDKVPDNEAIYRALVALGNIVRRHALLAAILARLICLQIYAARVQKSKLSDAELNQAKMAYGIARNLGDARMAEMAQDISAIIV